MTGLLLSRSGTPVRMGSTVGSGGEGTVFAIEGQGDSVAKVYSTTPSEAKVQKLRAMVDGADEALSRVAAWPSELLVDARRAVRGVVMPRIKARRDFHELYSPKSRGEAFPEADYRFLVHVAANVCRAFAVVHEHGHVIGDVNHASVLVGPDGLVRLIDCDSFQIRRASATFTCDVGVPLFTPPELQGRVLRGQLRTENHDGFGLAVLLFHLLFMGRHPFAGRYSGPGDMPIEKAISESRFAYGPDRAKVRMDRPPATAALETVGAAVSRLFIAAFSGTSSQAGRPSPREWLSALEGLKSDLIVCARSKSHQYAKHNSTCPWCAIESQSGARLFGLRLIPTSATGVVDIGVLWQAIQAAKDPGEEPPLPNQTTARVAEGISARAACRALSIAIGLAGFSACAATPDSSGGAFGVIGSILALILWPRVPQDERLAANSAVISAQAQWNQLQERWRKEASLSAFLSLRTELEKAKQDLADLPNVRRSKLARLESQREAGQRTRYLDRFRIDRATISQIGSGRKSMLSSFGIETAADVDSNKILDIPGFGEVLTGELLKWRRTVEAGFCFNPAEPLDPHAIAALDRELNGRGQSLYELLRNGRNRLDRASVEIIAARQRLLPILEAAWKDLQSAEARKRWL